MARGTFEFKFDYFNLDYVQVDVCSNADDQKCELFLTSLILLINGSKNQMTWIINPLFKIHWTPQQKRNANCNAICVSGAI